MASRSVCVASLALGIACGSGSGAIDGDSVLDTSEPADDTAGGDLPDEDAGLVDRMDVDRLVAHLDALQAIGDAQSSTRVAGSEGFNESAAYVASELEAAGYTVTWQEFPYRVWFPVDDPVLQWDDATFEADRDIAVLSYSPGGDVSAEVTAVDVVVPISGGENTSSSGCEAEDFAQFTAGHIALIQRGTCTFATKALLAEQAGAAAVIVFNEGQAGRRGVVEGTLGGDTELGIPVLGASYSVGEQLVGALAAGPVELQLVIDVVSESQPTWNLLADLDGDTDELVVVGAHLDSVSAGPGINDNGSGSALVLELAIQAAAMDTVHRNTLRFAWWGAEEAGLIGSAHYVATLSDDDLDRHVANLNFDMVASPNGGRFVYDGDNSDTQGGYPAPAGSELIEDLFTEFFDTQDLAHAATAFDGRSDYGPFIYYGIPAGGLFSGAEMPMSAQQAETFGAESGEAMDACYHRACDDTLNIDTVLYLDLARAAAHATAEMAEIEALGARQIRGVDDPSVAAPRHHVVGDHQTAGCGSHEAAM